jgi:4-hydroxy 2-oxovalerate aldolase
MDVFAKHPHILDVTLRDGSYLIEFQFTAQDTALIASALEAVGFRWIEIGHGLGLNASASGKGSAAATDEEYLEAAAGCLSAARWGMFFIPGIGREEDLRLASRYKMDFVRIGTNVTDLSDAERFIGQAKELGMLVAYNAMKSYAVSPEEWGRNAAQAHEWGADIVCLVDSAGSMDPEEVSRYLRAAHAHTPVHLGFHGHDNLSLAMANTLRAIDEGAVLVDSSLQGMGRSAGNAITEVLVAILKKRGALADIDMKAVMDIGDSLIRPLLGRRGVDSMAVTGGFAKFHSSFTPKLVRYALKHDIDVRDLIVRLCEEDLVFAPDDVLERLGGELAHAKMPHVFSIPAFTVHQREILEGRESLDILLNELRPHAIKAGKFSALNAVIAEAPQERIRVSGNIQHTPTHVAVSVTYTTDQQLETILQSAEGKVDVLLLDVDQKAFGPSYPATTATQSLTKTRLLTYLDSRVWVSAIEDQLARILGENLERVPIVIAGDHPKSRLLTSNLVERRAQVTLLSNGSTGPTEVHRGLSFSPEPDMLAYFDKESPEARDRLAVARMIVVWPGGAPWFGAAEANLVPGGACVLDAELGGIVPEGIETMRRRDIRLIRQNLWPTLAGVLFAAHESQNTCMKAMGRTTIAGIPVVAGGAMGSPGDVVVDDIHRPSRVIGVADDQGKLVFKYTAEEARCVQRVVEEINSRILLPRRTSLE